MKKSLIKNTKKSGIARIIIFPTNKKYKAVCLDFDIIEEAENLHDVTQEIKEAVKGYVMNIIKNNLDDELLNRSADEKYWKMYFSYLELLNEHNRKKEIEARSKLSKYTTISMPVSELVKEPACC